MRVGGRWPVSYGTKKHYIAGRKLQFPTFWAFFFARESTVLVDGTGNKHRDVWPGVALLGNRLDGSKRGADGVKRKVLKRQPPFFKQRQVLKRVVVVGVAAAGESCGAGSGSEVVAPQSLWKGLRR